MDTDFRLSSSQLIQYLRDTRERTLRLVEDLNDGQLTVPKLEIVNPPLWEIGHVAFFYEIFALRPLDHTGPIVKKAEDIYDSFAVAHDDRWDLPLLNREACLDYLETVLDRLIDRLNSHEPNALETYLYLLGIFHEDMHGEAITYTRQTLEYAKPTLHVVDSAADVRNVLVNAGRLSGDVAIPGGSFDLGAAHGAQFVYDNEKWAHEVRIPPFNMAGAPVTNGEFAEFVDSGGYEQTEHWSYCGGVWLSKSNAKHPLYWRRENGQWFRRHFDTYYPIEEDAPVIHVNWYEAEAYCNWSNRRLPTEAEWEFASAAAPSNGGQGVKTCKRIFPWGDEPPSFGCTNLDSLFMGCVDVAAFPEGDSAFGCRQMIGNVWEWTASAFYPYPGYVVDEPYKEYSAPWFGYHKALRGGSWATRSRLIRNSYRNYFLPHRNDIFAGFRTCSR